MLEFQLLGRRCVVLENFEWPRDGDGPPGATGQAAVPLKLVV